MTKVCFYIRPETDFTSVEALVERIHQDAAVTREALTHPSLAAHSRDTTLQPASQRTSVAPDASVPHPEPPAC